jgi:RNA-binding protein YlmH
VASPRLDAVLGSAFSLSRSKAAAYIAAGKVALNHRECLKCDKTVEEGDVLTCRGLGKCVVKEVPGQSKKGRTMLVLERYI